jgi:hypothetical protein
MVPGNDVTGWPEASDFVFAGRPRKPRSFDSPRPARRDDGIAQDDTVLSGGPKEIDFETIPKRKDSPRNRSKLASGGRLQPFLGFSASYSPVPHD